MTTITAPDPVRGGAGVERATPVPRVGAVAIAAVLAILALLARVLQQVNELDWDMFHEMALFRAALELGFIPAKDLFAFTPTVEPCVHHEWGTGMIFYAVSVTGGIAGLLVFKYLVTAAIIAVVAWTARLRGASWSLVLAMAPIAILLGHIGFVTVRAQLFTVLFTAMLLFLLDRDREGSRRWLLPWLVVHVAWLNLHAGFVVGMGLLGFHWFEQVLRRRTPQWHLILAGTGMAALMLVNPYGIDYVRYLIHALTMPRPRIEEWQGIRTNLPLLGGYVASLLLLLYSIHHVGWRRMHGLLIVCVLAYLALRHQRHASMYAIAWMCYVPAWLQKTPLPHLIQALCSHRRRATVAALLVVTVACLVQTDLRGLWHVRIPTHPADATPGSAVYPAGAVEYLRDQQFRGNVMTSFEVGSYVMWHLFPAVKVGLDSRYEVAYQPGEAERIMAMYDGLPGWRGTLERYPSDAVLVANTDPLAGLLIRERHWRRVYHDDAYALFARISR